MLNSHYRDMLSALYEEGVRFLLVGAYAMAAHGYVRATADLDIWIEPTPKNAQAAMRALDRFGAPLQDLTAADLERHDTVFQIGVAPLRIDLLTSVTGLDFEEAHNNTVETNLGGIPVRMLSLDDLIRNKRALGRTRDKADAEALEALKRSLT